MTVNMGAMDRLIRLMVGLVLIAASLLSGMALFEVTWIKYLAVVVGIVMLVTSAMRFCPLYTILGKRTCKG